MTRHLTIGLVILAALATLAALAPLLTSPTLTIARLGVVAFLCFLGAGRTLFGFDGSDLFRGRLGKHPFIELVRSDDGCDPLGLLEPIVIHINRTGHFAQRVEA